MKLKILMLSISVVLLLGAGQVATTTAQDFSYTVFGDDLKYATDETEFTYTVNGDLADSNYKDGDELTFTLQSSIDGKTNGEVMDLLAGTFTPAVALNVNGDAVDNDTEVSIMFFTFYFYLVIPVDGTDGNLFSTQSHIDADTHWNDGTKVSVDGDEATVVEPMDDGSDLTIVYDVETGVAQSMGDGESSLELKSGFFSFLPLNPWFAMFGLLAIPVIRRYKAN